LPALLYLVPTVTNNEELNVQGTIIENGVSTTSAVIYNQIIENITKLLLLYIFLLLRIQLALQPLVGFRPAQLSLSILSRKALQSAVACGTSNPQLGGEPGI
jgi:hypothetical protein